MSFLIPVKYIDHLNTLYKKSVRFSKEQESQSRQLLSQLNLLIDHLPIAAALLDKDMKLVWATQFWISEFGLDSKNLMGRSYYEIFPEIPQHWKKVHQKCLQGSIQKADEDLMNTKSGSIKWIKWEIHPWKDHDGHICGIIIFHENITEQKKAELELKKINEELERRVKERTHEIALQATILNNIDAGVLMARTKDGKIVYANPKFSALFGYREGELNGKPLWTLNYERTPGFAKYRAQEIMNEILKQGSLTYEVQNVHKDGSPFWCRGTTSTFNHYEYGEVFVAVQQDITEEKLAAERLIQSQEAEERVKSKVEAVTQASSIIAETIVNLHKTGFPSVLKTVALQAQMITGAEMIAIGIGSNPEVPFDPWVTLGMPDEIASKLKIPRPVGTLATVSQGNHSVRLSQIKNHPNYQGLPPGHPPISSFLGVPIRFAGRSIGNLFLANKKGGERFTLEDQFAIQVLAERAASMIEIARLYQAESEQMAWIQNVLEQMPEAILIVDSRRNFIQANQKAIHYACTDIKKVNFQTTSAFELLSLDGKPSSLDKNPIVHTLRTGEVSGPSEFWLIDKNKQRIPVVASAFPIQNSAGALTGGVLVIQNISYLRQVQQLTDEWTAILSHDLRQLVSVISLNSQLLHRSFRSNTSKNENTFISNIQSSSQSLRKLINDLLDATKIDAKQLVLNVTSIDLNNFTKQYISQIKPLLSKHPVNLVRNADHALISADPIRIKQVLGKLLSNAAKYGKEETPIDVCIDRIEEGIKVSVTNHGSGIHLEDLPYLFTRFPRTRLADHTGSAIGTGLGLYICRGIIEAHAGKIWAESIPSQKTTFSFLLPSIELTPTEVMQFKKTFQSPLQVRAHRSSQFSGKLFSQDLSPKQMDKTLNSH